MQSNILSSTLIELVLEQIVFKSDNIGVAVIGESIINAIGPT